MSGLSLREALIEEAQDYADNDEPLPLDLISDLMANGIDHTEFTNTRTDTDETHPGEIHNVD